MWAYDGSAAQMIMALLPEHPWRPWKFAKTPKGWWPSLVESFNKGDIRAIATVIDYLSEIQTQNGLEHIRSVLSEPNLKLSQTQQDQLAYFGGLPAISSVLNSLSIGTPLACTNSFCSQLFTRNSLQASNWACDYKH